MTYRILPLPLAPFAPLFPLDDDALLALGGRRMTADAPNSAPCRVSLIDAAPGERLILLNHTHLDAPSSPYRGGGPIFVREAAVEAELGCRLPRPALAAPTPAADQVLLLSGLQCQNGWIAA